MSSVIITLAICAMYENELPPELFDMILLYMRYRRPRTKEEFMLLDNPRAEPRNAEEYRIVYDEELDPEMIFYHDIPELVPELKQSQEHQSHYMYIETYLRKALNVGALRCALSMERNLYFTIVTDQNAIVDPTNPIPKNVNYMIYAGWYHMFGVTTPRLGVRVSERMIENAIIRAQHVGDQGFIDGLMSHGLRYLPCVMRYTHQRPGL